MSEYRLLARPLLLPSLAPGPHRSPGPANAPWRPTKTFSFSGRAPSSSPALTPRAWRAVGRSFSPTTGGPHTVARWSPQIRRPYGLAQYVKAAICPDLVPRKPLIRQDKISRPIDTIRDTSNRRHPRPTTAATDRRAGARMPHATFLDRVMAGVTDNDRAWVSTPQRQRSTPITSYNATLESAVTALLFPTRKDPLRAGLAYSGANTKPAEFMLDLAQPAARRRCRPWSLTAPP